MPIDGERNAQERNTRNLWLVLLFASNLVNFFDRQILAAVTEPLRHEWNLSDTELGWLITAFTLLYATIGLPLGRLADLWRRKLLLSAGLGLWSCMTFVSGLCRSFWPLFAARLGVGIGEASCAPASTSLIGDLYRPAERARAMSIFMLGLPVGVALSYLLGGACAQRYGWRAAFFLAGAPGLLLAGLALLLPEPARGRSEETSTRTGRRPGSPTKLILGTRTMQWIILSGLLHNFIMYAFTFFLPALLVRYYGANIQSAGFVSAAVTGAVGALGMFASGWVGDSVATRRPDGRMLVAATAVLAAAPLWSLALMLPGGALLPFVAYQGTAAFLMYTYYANVYATIHDVVEPVLRGRAIAMYFFAMYTMGASLGPVATGWLSDLLARRAALATGWTQTASTAVPEHFRALGLHQAMYMMPSLTLVLAIVLFCGSSTVGTDVRNLRRWAQGINPEVAGFAK